MVQQGRIDIRIATRKSELALWQARHVAEKLAALPQTGVISLVPLSTRGDEILDKSLQKIGGKGLFIKELEIAMQTGTADIAVHSMKDVPAVMPDGFCIAAVLERANPADAFVSANKVAFADLPLGAKIGSSSLRRQSQLLAVRPDLVISPLRGNVNTRLQKLEDGLYDAIILASAGLERLGLDAHITSEFSADVMQPAAAQGVIGIECREDQQELRHILSALEHSISGQTTAAERRVAAVLNANCQSPVASYAITDGEHLTIDALVASADGSTVIRKQRAGLATDAETLGELAANDLLEAGAGELLIAESA
ncbi:MAG: hydroxymethylbilane synthase [Woeseia sp.]|nr:hydroxymethylbilane synthase [Woeseia sp.]